MVVSSISLKQISLHRCLAEGLWIASLDFPFILALVRCGNIKPKCHYGCVTMDTVNKGGNCVKKCIIKF